MRFSADDILSIPIDSPDLLFPEKELYAIKSFFRKLVRVWHPDVNTDPQASSVFAHINKLYLKAKYKSETDTWDVIDAVSIHTLDGKVYRFKYLYTSPFELGILYVNSRYIAYFVRKEHSILFNNAIARIQAFKFSSDRMKQNVGTYVPNISHVLHTKTHDIVLFAKNEDTVPMRALLTYYNNSIHPKHVAWIISSLYNICCYLAYIETTHNAIAIDTCFVSPKQHCVYLIGGWWFSTDVGSKLVSMPKSTYAVCPASVKRSKCSSYSVDTQCLRAVGRELLGDVVGATLKLNNEIPRILTTWAMFPGTDDAVQEYAYWMDTILPGAYGKRKFIKMDARNDIQQIYNKSR